MPMFCPNCGTQPQLPDQKFCKSCGTNLLVVSHALHTATMQPPGVGYAGANRGMPAAPGAMPPGGYQPNPLASPIPLSAIESLPFMQEEAKRQKLARWGWMTMGGGFLVGMFLSIIGNALEKVIGRVGHAVEELGALGGMMIVIGLFTLIYAKLILKKPAMPSVLVVQQPTGMTTGLSQQQPMPQAQPQLNPPPVSSYLYPPAGVTEHTTHHLHVPVANKETK